MSLHVDFDGLWDVQTKARIDRALRSCIGDPPQDEEWSALVTSYGSYCIVLVKTLQQTRRKLFLLRALELSEAIPGWLKQYPLQ